MCLVNRTALIFVAMMSIGIPAFAATDTTVLSRRAKISMTLDSLEFEKQECKRQGRSLDALESRCHALRDSLDRFRASASGASFSPVDTSTVKPKQSVTTGKKPSIFKNLSARIPSYLVTATSGLLNPKSPFDWIMLLVTLVAILSGLVLFFGIITMIRDRLGGKKRKGSARGLPPPPPARAALPPPRPTASPVAMLQKLKDTNAKPEPKQIPTPETSVQDTAAAEALRSRMRAEEAPKPIPPQVTKETVPEPQITGASLRERVLSAHNIGLPPEEIAKNLHVSLDQVKLILRVAGLTG